MKKAAQYLFQSFQYSVFEGGVVNFDNKGRMYLEEAVTEKISCILDGLYMPCTGYMIIICFMKTIQLKRFSISAV